jgi:hypothetical protein
VYVGVGVGGWLFGWVVLWLFGWLGSVGSSCCLGLACWLLGLVFL